MLNTFIAKGSRWKFVCAAHMERLAKAIAMPTVTTTLPVQSCKDYMFVIIQAIGSEIQLGADQIE